MSLCWDPRNGPYTFSSFFNCIFSSKCIPRAFQVYSVFLVIGFQEVWVLGELPFFFSLLKNFFLIVEKNTS